MWWVLLASSIWNVAEVNEAPSAFWQVPVVEEKAEPSWQRQPIQPTRRRLFFRRHR